MDAESDRELLIHGYFSGELSPDQVRELVDLWNRSEEFRQRFRELQETEHLLCFFARLDRKPLSVNVDGKRFFATAAEGILGCPTEMPIVSSLSSIDFDEILRIAEQNAESVPSVRNPIEPPGMPNALLEFSRSFFRTVARRLPTRRFVVRSIVFGFLLTGIVLLLQGLLHRSFSLSRGSKTKTVAHLSGFDNVVWGDCLAPILPGDPIENGWLRIVSGSVALKLLNGSSIVLEGPAEFRIDDDTDIYLQHGFLSADVPPLRKKLKIKTAQIDVNVLGTAFWIKANDTDSEVHLLRGKLELGGKSFGKLLLDAGEAFLLPKNGKSRRFEVVREDFVSSETVVAKTEATLLAWETGHTPDARETELLEGDPSMLVHFDFKKMGRTVPNVAPVGRRTIPSGKLLGCSRSEGRKASRPGIAFRRLNDQIAVEVPGKYKSMTLACWVNVDKPVEFRLPLFMTSGMPPGAVQWMIGRGGGVQFNVAKTDDTKPVVAKTPPIFTGKNIGKWVHLSTVVDAETKTVVFYVDGETVETIPLFDEPVIVIGNAMLGSWDFNRNKNMPVENFCIADFMLFDRVLNDEEIGKLAEK